jgi:hypothetical protein
LAEIDPGVAAGARRIGGDVIAAGEFHFAGGHQPMGILAADLLVVIDPQSLPFPGTGLGYHMHEREMAR